jgi:hypothetical protein
MTARKWVRPDPMFAFRVIYAPRQTFEEFRHTAPIGVLVPVVVIAILTTARAYVSLPQKELLGLVSLLTTIAYGALVMLAVPLVLTLYVFLLWWRLGTREIGFWSLFLAFVLCAFPSYLGALLGVYIEWFYFGLGDLFRLSMTTQPFLYGMLETITPFFLWTIALWWVAITVLLRPIPGQRVVLVGSLVLLEALINGAQRIG